MINGIHIKVCGLTSVVDSEAAYTHGADFLGFNLYPKSPRYVSLSAFKAMEPNLPPGKKVAVTVEPSHDELKLLLDSGFDSIQLHFPNETSFFEAVLWAEIVPPARLWMAPRVPPGREIDPAFFPLADTFLFDSYQAETFGGTGKTSNWSEFASLRLKYTKIHWVLAGGLNAENVATAIAATGTTYVDVNSGVEVSPGVKDHAKLQAFAHALQRLKKNEAGATASH